MSIGDLFGDDLKSLFGTEADTEGSESLSLSQPEEDSEDVQLGVSSEGDGVDGAIAFISTADSSTGPANDAESAVRGILSELSRTDPPQIDLDSELESLGATGLGLWAVVAEVERQTGLEFGDQEVETWRTPRDIIDQTKR